MFHHRIDDEFEKSVFVKWYLLSFLSGAVNTGAFLGAGKFVTHVTGFATLFGVEMARGKLDVGLGLLLVPVFFLTGAIIAAFMVDHRYHQGKPPHYDWVMLAVFGCLLITAVGGQLHWLGGRFGGAERMKEDFVLLALLCLASGLQNAAITTSSGASVRTTHLTGLTTDLGIGIVRVLSQGSRPSPTRYRELRANWLRVGTIVSFALGSAVGAALYVRVGYLGFLLPAAIALYAFIQARIDHPKILEARSRRAV
jgi:uncharacterized membrane protein YoaK (UPF0700 family)